MRKNIDAVTYAKGIAILMMVAGHAGLMGGGYRWISMFHIPLFFMMSGYCFRDSNLVDFKGFLKKRFVGIYWPFLKWSVVFILLHNFFLKLNIYSTASTYKGVAIGFYDLKEIIHRLISVVFSLNYNEQLLGGYWFLRELFLGYIIFYICVLHTRNKWSLGGGLIFVNMVILHLGTGTNFYSGLTLLAAFFIWCGYMVRSKFISFYKKKWFPFIGFGLVTLGSLFWPASCLEVSAITYIPYVMTAVIGSLSVLHLCERLDSLNIDRIKGILIFIGSNTLTILTWHFLSFKLVSYLILKVYGLQSSSLGYFPTIKACPDSGWEIAYFATGILVPLFLSFLNKFITSKFMRF